MARFLWLLLALLFVAGLYLAGGFALIWSLNTLFGLGIPNGFAELAAGGLLLALWRSPRASLTPEPRPRPTAPNAP